MTRLLGLCALCLVACARAASPAPTTPVTPPAPAKPPAPPADAWGSPAALADPRPASWGGSVGVLADVKWMTLSSRTVIHAYLAGYFERDAVVVVRRGAAGLEVAALVTSGGYRVTTTGVVGVSTSIVPAADMRSAGRENTEFFVPFVPVRASALPAIALAFDHAPVPATPTGSVWQGIAVEISTTSAHVRAEVAGGFGPMRAVLGAAPAPAPMGPSQDLSEMASRLADLLGA
jgi:hypothetical protein